MIGLCIKYFNRNYGGMLQAYATVKMLEELGIEYKIIRYYRGKSLKTLVYDLPRLFNKVWQVEKFELVQKKIQKILHPSFGKNDGIRALAFDRFAKEAFEEHVSYYFGLKQLKENVRKYQMVVSGSDQLWSPSGLGSNFYNLMFVPDDIRKVSLASSFGVSSIPSYQIKRTKEYLNRMDAISMREMRGAKIVYELTGRNVPVVADPVFMFDKNEWLKLIPSNRKVSEKYIFVYFLGKTPEHRRIANIISKKKGYKIVTIRHADQYVSEDENFGDISPYDVDPGDFLNYLREADFVCTDSFHASVFSVIYEKPFIVFDRFAPNSIGSKNSRIDSLCSLLSLENCRYHEDFNLDEILTREWDYSEANKKLKELKELTLTYIQSSMC